MSYDITRLGTRLVLLPVSDWFTVAARDTIGQSKPTLGGVFLLRFFFFWGGGGVEWGVVFVFGGGGGGGGRGGLFVSCRF